MYKMKIKITIEAFLFFILTGTGYCQTTLVVSNYQKEIKELISGMTLDEKIAQLGGMGAIKNEFGDLNVRAFGTKGNSRIRIPDLIMGHGITGVRPGRDTSARATYFCTPFAIASTWDADLYGKVGIAMAKEMRALGQNLNLGPTLNIIRHPLGGRNWECFSEDPYLISRLIVPYVKSMQSNGIISGPKHFMANNQETNRFDINNVVDDRTLNEIYFPAFRAAVEEGGSLNIMASYNRVNGTYMCENKYYLTDILRKKWGFKGFVLSDFSYGVRSTHGSVNAGLNVEMHNTKFYGESLVQAVKNGEIPVERIDELLAEKLYAMFKVGMFDPTYPTYPKSVIHCDEHQQISLEVARKSPILLKNEGNTLPLTGVKIKSIAVIGPNSVNFTSKNDPNYASYLQGGGSGRCYYFYDAIVSPLEGIKRHAGEKHMVSYAGGCMAPNATDTTGNEALLHEALSIASTADVVILVAGLSGFNETEGKDRKNAFLPESQIRLIEEITKVNSNIVLVMIAGSYIEFGKWIDRIPAVLFCPYSGEKIGNGIGEILFGKYCPEGKLPFSYPFRAKDYPASSLFSGKEFSSEPVSNVYSEGIYVGYRYFAKQNIDVRYPFGYGLSYTNFEYTDLTIPNTFTSDSIQIFMHIRNAGKFKGTEIVQLYISENRPLTDRPVKELKGFTKISLDRGENKTIRFVMKKSDFSCYDPELHAFKVNPGFYTISIGSSSEDIKAKGVTEIR